jgi:hypothetical protein
MVLYLLHPMEINLKAPGQHLEQRLNSFLTAGKLYTELPRDAISPL